LVICWVLFTERMRLRMSRRLAMWGNRVRLLQPGRAQINRSLEDAPCQA
jgi:hypothetical protein